MTEPAPDLLPFALGELLAGVDVETRVDHVVIFTTPHGGTVEYPADGETLAKIMAFALDRDARAAGIADAEVAAIRRTWVLANEEEILTTGAGQT